MDVQDKTLSPDAGSKQDPTAKQSVKEQQGINLLIKTPHKEIVKLQVSLNDTVQDIRQCLFEAKEICYITAYELRFNGEPIDEFNELAQLPGLTDGSTFEMVEVAYTSVSCGLHVRAVRELLDCPLGKPISVLSSLIAEESLAPKQKKEAVPEPKPAPKPTPVSNSGKGKKKRNNKNKKKAAAPLVATGQVQQSSGPSSPSGTLDFNTEVGEFNLKNFFPREKPAPPACVQSICYSGWNPPPGNRRCKGDLLYLIIRTLESRTIHVTGSTKGFFINGSTSTNFDPSPIDKVHSHTLVGLLNAVSPLFKHNFEILLDNHFEKHPLEILGVSYAELNLPWLSKPFKHTFDLNRAEDFALGREPGEPPRHVYNQLRDWNAEYQACRELPKSTPQERILRDRGIIKVYQDFVSYAVIGARSIVTGGVLPVNPNDPPQAHLYICNNIFFSHALNGRFLYDEGDDMTPYKQVNNDLHGVITYNLFDIPDLHTVLTALVNYRGYRIVAQSIIPGILHQTGNTCIKYGAIERGETLVWREDFHTLISKAGAELHVPEHEVKDQDGNSVKLCCSSDTKGVKGTDGKKYVLDLDRTTVRDVNFNLPWSLIRLELYDIYIEYLKHQHVLEHKSKYEEFAHRHVEREKRKSTNPDFDPEQDPEITEEQLGIPKFVPPKFNPNAMALTHGELVGDPAELEDQKEQVRKLSKFLEEHAIPGLVKDINSNAAYPTDSVTLTGIFHSRGINIRYLGQFTKLLGDSKPFIRDLCVREMIARSTKHLMREYLRTLKEHEIVTGTVHFLNCFIRGAYVQNYCNPNAPAQSHVAESFGISPEKLWVSITEKINSQFKYEYRNEFKPTKYMLPTLRTLCQQMGIQIVARDYDFYNPTPISDEDFVDFFPVVKSATPLNGDGREILDGGKALLLQGRIDLSFEFLTEALAMFHQTYGPMHPYTAHCYSNLAMVLYHAGDIPQALLHQKKAVIIHERCQGLDHHETAFGYGYLGLFCHHNNQTQLGLKFIRRSLDLSFLIAGPDHPDNASTYSTIAMILQDNKRYKEALEFLLKALECTETHYGAKHSNTAAACHSVAIAFSMLDGFRNALQFERRGYDILMELVGPNDIRTVEAGIWMKQFTAKAVQMEVDANKSPEPTRTQSKANEPKIPTLLNDTEAGHISNLPISDLLRYINSNGEPVISRSQQRLRANEYNTSKLLRNVGPKRS